MKFICLRLGAHTMLEMLTSIAHAYCKYELIGSGRPFNMHTTTNFWVLLMLAPNISIIFHPTIAIYLQPPQTGSANPVALIRGHLLILFMSIIMHNYGGFGLGIIELLSKN